MSVIGIDTYCSMHDYNEMVFVCRHIKLYENGKVITEKVALELVDRYNRMNFLKNHSVGDEVTVFGRKYKIDEDGHIHVPTEDFWVSGEFNTK